jgi:hypothetical protein
MAKPRIRRIHSFSPCTLRGVFWPSSKTKAPARTGGSFCKARSPWSCLASSTSADDWYLVCKRAEDVEDEVVDEQCRPWANGDDA